MLRPRWHQLAGQLELDLLWSARSTNYIIIVLIFIDIDRIELIDNSEKKCCYISKEKGAFHEMESNILILNLFSSNTLSSQGLLKIATASTSPD
jgi:hypothetical protein